MTFVGYKSGNNLISYLVSAVSSTSTTIVVNDGGIFPSSFPYLLTIEQKFNGETTVREIVKVTAKSGNTMTITRAVESCVQNDTLLPKIYGQVAHNFETGSIVSLTMTAGTLKDVQDEMTSQGNRISTAEDNITALTGLITTLENDIQNL